MIVGFIAPTDYSRACTLSVSIRAMAYKSARSLSEHSSATRDTATEINAQRRRGWASDEAIAATAHIVSGSVSGELESSSSYNRVPVTLRGARTGASRIGPGPPTQAGWRFMSGICAYELIATRVAMTGKRPARPGGQYRKGGDVSGVCCWRRAVRSPVAS